MRLLVIYIYQALLLKFEVYDQTRRNNNNVNKEIRIKVPMLRTFQKMILVMHILLRKETSLLVLILGKFMRNITFLMLFFLMLFFLIQIFQMLMLKLQIEMPLKMLLLKLQTMLLMIQEALLKVFLLKAILHLSSAFQKLMKH